MGERIAASDKVAWSRAASNCGGNKIALQMPAIGTVHRRIELDQHVTGFYRLAVTHVNGADHARFERAELSWYDHWE